MTKTQTTTPAKINTQTLQSQQRKERFLESYRETRGHITDCARALGIDRSTYYHWLDEDKDFARSIATAEAELNDDMRKALIDKGADGDLGAIIFYLKNRHPEFKPQPWVQVNQQSNTLSLSDDQLERLVGG